MATPFRPAFDLLASYAEYHRDRRNILTHLVGVPMIVFGVAVLLARPSVGGVSAGWILYAVAALWYLTRGEFVLGAATAAGIGVLMLLAHPVAAGSTAAWLACGVGFFAVGWLIQFVGHYYEGRKPAFTDDVVGLLTGPMFVVLEMLAGLGAMRSLSDRIERRVGPTLLRDLAHPAT